MSSLLQLRTAFSAVLVVCFSLLAPLAHADTLASVKADVAGRELIQVGSDLASTEPNQPLHLTFQLVADDSALDSYITQLYDTKSRNYHNWVTPTQFGQKFGAPPSNVTAVTAWIEANGMTVTKVWENNRFISATTTVAAAESALHVTINSYARPSSELSSVLSSDTIYAPDSAPSMPSNIASMVAYVAGLSNNVVTNHGTFSFQPAAPQPIPASAPVGPTPLTNPASPTDLKNLYDFTTLDTDAAAKHENLLIGIFSPTLVNLSDIQSFESKYGISDPTPIEAFPTGERITSAETSAGTESEACLDAETIMGQVPNVQITFYEGDDSTAAHITDSYNEIASDNLPVISSSWTNSESANSAATLKSLDSIIKQMVAQGQTFVNSSGDSGPYPYGFNEIPSNPVTGIEWPSSGEYALSVGGTESPTVNANGSWASETGWGDYNGNTFLDGSGGGLSVDFLLPSWQTGPGVPNTQFRQVPDVAALAGTPGYDIFANGGEGESRGTSASTPLWASALLLTDEALGTRLGLVNTAIYQIGQNPTQYASAFHDITTGTTGNITNSSPVFSATTNWDYVTGWGSPDFSNLMTVLSNIVPVTGPIITNATVSPGTLPSTGGTITVSATVAESNPSSNATISSVSANIIESGNPVSVVKTIALSNGGSGTTYTGTFSAPANTTTSSITFTASVSAVDSQTQSGGPALATGSTVVAGVASTNPSVTNATISPANLPAGGGTITLSATVTDPNVGATLNSVSGQVFKNGTLVANVNLSNGGSGSTYTGTTTASPNTTSTAQTYTGTITATDNLSKTSGAVNATGSTVVAVASALSLTNVTISPANLPVGGGTITVSATVTDPNVGASINSVSSQVFKNGTLVANVTLSNGGSGTTYTGTTTASANATSSVQTYTANVSASDSFNATAGPVVATGSTIVAVASALSITNVTISPANLPVGGGTITVTATVTDPNVGATVNSVSGQVFRNGTLFANINLSNGGSGTVYTGTATASPNTTSSVQTYTAKVSASDSFNGTAGPVTATGSTAVGVASALSITNVAISPTNLPVGGGTITVTATVTDPNVGATVNSVSGQVFRNGTLFANINLSNGGSGTVYTGTATASPNTTSSVQTYTAKVSASDSFNGTAGPVTATGSTVVAIASPLSITNATISPANLPVAGGTITLSATVTDPNVGATVNSVSGQVLRDGTLFANVSLSNGGSGSTYTGTFTAGANSTGTTHTFTGNVSASDSFNATAGPVAAAGTTVIAIAQPPVISNAAISPADISISGGTITVSATVTDPNVGGTVSSVTGQVFRDGTLFENINLSNTGGSSYSGSFSAPSTAANTTHTFTATVSASDSFNAGAGPVNATGSTFQGALVAPVITNATISPATLPDSGGTITVSATVTDSNPSATLTSVTANVLENGASPTPITLSNGGSGSTYSGTFNAPSNATTSSIAWTANVSATDSLSQSAGPVAATGSTVEAGIPLVAPSITNATISPATLPSTGGTITISATVTDSNPGATISTVLATLNSNTSLSFPILMSNGGSGNIYTATRPIAPNTTTSSITWTATVQATDSANQTGGPVNATGSTVQAGVALVPPAITNATISPATLPSSGGTITVSATVTDSNPSATLSSVTAEIIKNGSSNSPITLSNGGSGSTYTGTFSAPANTTTTSITYTAAVSASDSDSESAGPVAATGSTVEAGVTLVPPVINNATISPATLPLSGGTITVSAMVTDSNPSATLTSVTANVLENGGAPIQITLSNGGSGSTYTGTFSAPANTTTTAITWTANVSASDNLSQSAGPVAATGSTVEAGVTLVPPSITNATISPATLPSNGGTITISATVTDPNPGASLTTVTAKFNNGTLVTNVPMSNGGSGSVYTATLNAPANTTTSPITYTGAVIAVDSDNQMAQVNATGSTVEAGLAAPLITNATISPATLPDSGGTITISATVTDPNPGASLATITASFKSSTNIVTNVAMSNGGSGSTYTATFNAPANTTTSPITYTGSITASDTAGQLAGPIAATGSTVEAGVTIVPPIITNATISPANLPSSGGTISVTATVTDVNPGATISTVTASFKSSTNISTNVSMSNGGSGSVYTATMNAAPNTSTTPITFTASVIATDSDNELSPAVNATGSTVEAGVVLVPPSITNATISPANLPSNGGTITISATITDSNPGGTLATVTAQFKNGINVTNVVMSNGGTGNVYTATMNAPANTTTSPITYTGDVVATDTVNQTAGPVAATGSTVEAGLLPPSITSATISPATLPSNGGTITISATITDANPGATLGTITAQFKNGINVENVIMSNGGSGSIYTATLNAPPNTTTSPITYTGDVVADDSDNQMAQVNATGSTVEAAAPSGAPVITNAAISPATLPQAGGTITVSATVTDSNPNATISTVTANVLTNGGSPVSVVLSNGGSGNVYTGSINVGVNTSTSPITYTASISATDSNSQSAGPVNASGTSVQAAAANQQAVIQGLSAINLGNGQLAVTVRNIGGSTATNLSVILARTKWSGVPAVEVTPATPVSVAPAAEQTFLIQFPASQTGSTVTLVGVYSASSFTTIIKITTP